jgi:phytoene dehydrogenase-like protein
MLVRFARRVYPCLGENAAVYEVATPPTYERYLHRPRGAVGGVRLTLENANQFAIPHDVGVPGFWLVGDTTWPGLGTVACVLGSRIVADGVAERARSRSRFASLFAMRRLTAWSQRQTQPVYSRSPIVHK